MNVPNIITGKDLDYLSDMYEWNYNYYKLINNYLDNINDDEIKSLLDKVSHFYLDSMQEVLNILKDGGVYE